MIKAHKDQICDHQDPRALRQFLSAGEKLALARKNEMSNLIRQDPEKVLSLAIEPEVVEKFPPQISSHLEKWENELVDLQTIHGCSLENHSHCEIEMFSKFSDGRNLRTWTYGDRKTPATISGISAWGISLGGEFAMSDSPIQEIAEEGEAAGKLLFGGKELTYNSAAEKEYFGELIEDTERRARRNSHGLNYSLIMGSDGSVSSFLRLKYEIHPEPIGFGG